MGAHAGELLDLFQAAWMYICTQKLLCTGLLYNNIGALCRCVDRCVPSMNNMCNIVIGEWETIATDAVGGAMRGST